MDAHQHFWIYNAAEHVWMTDEYAALRRAFMPEHLAPLLDNSDFDGSIAIQARQNLQETEWLLELAERNTLIKGVVGWVDLCSPEVEEQLRRYSSNPLFKGVRHVIHDEPDERYMLRDDFRHGISLLERYRLTYDLLLYPRHLPYAVQLVEQFPRQPFVLDHIGKPDIRSGVLTPWLEHMQKLSSLSNVYCKLSGMVTEAEWGNWKQEGFIPYLDAVFAAFGPERLMIGSDWPVSTVSGAYPDVMNIVKHYISNLTETEQEQVLGGNCARFYRVRDERIL